MNASTKKDNLSLDLLTILAIGVVSFIIKNVIHEAVGHGGACVLVGGTPLVLSSAHFDCDYTSVSDAGRRFVAAAGTLVNFIAAYFFWLVFHSKRVMSPSLRYFYWFVLRAMKTLIGSDPSERRVRAFRLTLFPYLAGAAISSLGAWFNPIGTFVILTSAAAAFGGSSAFAWMSQMLQTKWFPERSSEYVVIERNWSWIIIAVILALIHIFVLGPGVEL